MYIVNQKKNRVFNIDQFQQIFVMDNAIQCKWGSEVCVLGVYRDAERVQEVFVEMMDKIFPLDMVIFRNVSVSEAVIRRLKEVPVLMMRTESNQPSVEYVRPYVWYMPEA